MPPSPIRRRTSNRRLPFHSGVPAVWAGERAVSVPVSFGNVVTERVASARRVLIATNIYHLPRKSGRPEVCSHFLLHGSDECAAVGARPPGASPAGVSGCAQAERRLFRRLD